jgi:nitroreductase
MASNARHIAVMYRGPAQRGAISRKDREPMDVFEAIRTMQAVRQYQDRPVADDVLRQVLEAGRLTASGMNAQPWHFIVIQDPETLRQLGTLARTGPYIAGAPVAIAVAVDRTRLAVSDASRAIHSMLLTAWGNGVGGNWVASEVWTTPSRCWASRKSWTCWRSCRLATRRWRLAVARRSGSHWRRLPPENATVSRFSSSRYQSVGAVPALRSRV